MDIRAQPAQSVNLLLIEDDESDYILIKRMLAKAPGARMKLDWCRSYEEGKWRLSLDQHDAYLVDNRLDQASGLSLIQDMLDKGMSKPFILLTGLADRQLDQQAISLGADNFLPKNELSPTLLERVIRHAIEKRRADQALRQSEARLSAILDNAGAMISLKDWEGRYLLVNPQFERVHGLEPGYALGKGDEELFAEELAETRIRHDRHVLSSVSRQDAEEAVVTGAGTRTYLAKRFPICDEHGMAVSVGCIAADITERKALEEQLRRLSLKDGLTGLANRRFLDESLTREWNRLRRSKQPLAAIMADIDHFKSYNDCYGHQMGDECLKRTAACLQGVCRRPGDLAARYGGEEFVLILPGADLAGAIRVGKHVQTGLAALNLPHDASSSASRVTLSIGIAAAMPSEEEFGPIELLAQADQALYQAKKAGRNCIRAFGA